jgi:Protein of unknown function (DUF3433)
MNANKDNAKSQLHQHSFGRISTTDANNDAIHDTLTLLTEDIRAHNIRQSEQLGMENGAVRSGQPRIEHQPSFQTIRSVGNAVEASDEYYSFSEGYATEDDSLDERITAMRWGTPPQQRVLNSEKENIIPRNDSLNGESEATLPIKPQRAQQKAKRPQTPLMVRFNEAPAPVRRPENARTSTNSTLGTRAIKQNYTSPPTPGVDEGPIIRFALDSLTRDGGPDDGDSIEELYPVDRIIPDMGLGYLAEEARDTYGEGRQASLHSMDQDLRRSMSPAGVLLPVDVQGGSWRYPSLSFIPWEIRPIALGILIFLNILMIVGIIFAAVHTLRSHGLWAYEASNSRQYFIFRFLPQILGSILLLCLFSIELAIARVTPFMSMASGSTKLRSKAMFAKLFPSNFLLPRLTYFKDGSWMIGCCVTTFWLMIFTVPLLSSLFTPRYFPDAKGPGNWRWTVCQGVAWTLVSFYALLVIALTTLLIIFAWRSRWGVSGLKWDPVSIADTIATLQRSNVMDEFQDTELLATSSQIRSRLRNGTHRLGYWRSSENPEEIFYTMGEEGAPTRRYSLAAGKAVMYPQREERDVLESDYHDAETGGYQIYSTEDQSSDDINDPEVRFRHIPWFLRDGPIVYWFLITLFLFLFFLIGGLINQTFSHGFLPRLPAATNEAGFSPANFLYSFLPSCIGMFFFLAWQSLDIAYRVLTPFAALSTATPTGGSEAEESLLLDYTASPLIWVTVKAALRSHYRIAVLSFISVLSVLFPILAGGLLYTEFSQKDGVVEVRAKMSAFYLIVVVSVFYIAALFFAIPRSWRSSDEKDGGVIRPFHLPHPVTCLAEYVSFLYASALLDDDAFRDPESKDVLIERLTSGSAASKRDGPVRKSLIGRPKRVTQYTGDNEKMTRKYAFGVYKGRDGRAHVGIDWVANDIREHEMWFGRASENMV